MAHLINLRQSLGEVFRLNGNDHHVQPGDYVVLGRDGATPVGSLPQSVVADGHATETQDPTPQAETHDGE